MLRLKYSLFAFVAILSLSACEKKINWDAFPDNQNTCRLISSTTDYGDQKKTSGPVTITLGSSEKIKIDYTYDESGKVIKAVSQDGTKTYTYTDKKITGIVDGEILELTLDNGRTVASYNSNFLLGKDANRTYEYNADGYLSLIKSYLNKKLNSIFELTYSGGNLTQTKVAYIIGGNIETTNYEYSNQLVVDSYEMADPISVIPDYIPGNYFGKRSKNVLIKSVQRSSDTTNEVISNYIYKFDTKGNATSIEIKTETKMSNGDTKDLISIAVDLVYDCK